MIRIHCVNCKTLLEIDDGFAGGVCRCVHCGKMQAVPKTSRSGARAAGPDVGSRGFEGLERKLGTGVRILSPSSLSGSGHGSDNLSAAPSKKTIAAPAAKSNLRMLMFGVAVAIVVLIASILWVMSGGSGEKGTSVQTPSSTENSADIEVPKLSPRARTLDAPQEIPPVFAPPSFGGVTLTEPSVVYLIDRSGLSEESISQIKQAVLKSIDSLHTDQQFQIIVWKSDDGDFDTPIPANGLTLATPEALASAIADLAGDMLATKITERDEAPKIAEIAQPDFSAVGFAPKLDFSDNAGPPGQTFTPQSNMILRAVTVKGFANTPQSFAAGGLGRRTVTISRVDAGDVLTQLGQESGTGGFANGAAYETFTLSKPIPLIAGKQYAYDVFTENGFFGFAKSATDVYAGGFAIQHDKIARRSQEGGRIDSPQQVDRTFFINPNYSGTEGKSAIEKAIAQNPAILLLISGKNYDEPLAARVLEAWNSSAAKIDVVRVGDAKSPSDNLRKIADRTGGQYRSVELGALQSKTN